MPVLRYSLGTNGQVQPPNLNANFQEAPLPGNHAAQAVAHGQMPEGRHHVERGPEEQTPIFTLTTAGLKKTARGLRGKEGPLVMQVASGALGSLWHH